MDQNEIRLWQLTRALLAGEMTDMERREYDALRNEERRALQSALLKLARKQVGACGKV